MEPAPRLLVVDDEEDFLILLKEFLVKEGFEVATATSGSTALELVKRSRPDLVLTDLHMPGVGGIEMLRRLQELDPGVKAIAMTADAACRERHVRRWGAIGLIRKPLELEDALARIRQACDARGISEDRDRRKRAALR